MTEKFHERRAILIGGSIAGLFTGAFLRRIGWRVDIYERSSIELIGRGVGIFATHLELLEALDKCGAGTVDIGVIVYKRITFDRRGDVIAEKPQLQIVTSWDRLTTQRTHRLAQPEARDAAWRWYRDRRKIVDFRNAANSQGDNGLGCDAELPGNASVRSRLYLMLLISGIVQV
jgi:2-polyprenyl-6-methoxyphenol hydroxylase-like FAD-dependent oxidoreductase